MSDMDSTELRRGAPPEEDVHAHVRAEGPGDEVGGRVARDAEGEPDVEAHVAYLDGPEGDDVAY